MNRSNRTVYYNGWCLPTVIYLTLAIIGILMRALNGSYDMSSSILVGEVLHTLFWTAIMYWLCSRGYSGLSWFILLIPLILTTVFILFFETAVLRFLGAIFNTAGPMTTPPNDTTLTNNYVTYY